MALKDTSPEYHLSDFHAWVLSQIQQLTATYSSLSYFSRQDCPTYTKKFGETCRVYPTTAALIELFIQLHESMQANLTREQDVNNHFLLNESPVASSSTAMAAAETTDIDNTSKTRLKAIVDYTKDALIQNTMDNPDELRFFRSIYAYAYVVLQRLENPNHDSNLIQACRLYIIKNKDTDEINALTEKQESSALMRNAKENSVKLEFMKNNRLHTLINESLINNDISFLSILPLLYPEHLSKYTVLFLALRHGSSSLFQSLWHNTIDEKNAKQTQEAAISIINYLLKPKPRRNQSLSHLDYGFVPSDDIHIDSYTLSFRQAIPLQRQMQLDNDLAIVIDQLLLSLSQLPYFAAIPVRQGLYSSQVLSYLKTNACRETLQKLMQHPYISHADANIRETLRHFLSQYAESKQDVSSISTLANDVSHDSLAEKTVLSLSPAPSEHSQRLYLTLPGTLPFVPPAEETFLNTPSLSSFPFLYPPAMTSIASQTTPLHHEPRLQSAEDISIAPPTIEAGASAVVSAGFFASTAQSTHLSSQEDSTEAILRQLPDVPAEPLPLQGNLGGNASATTASDAELRVALSS